MSSRQELTGLVGLSLHWIPFWIMLLSCWTFLGLSECFAVFIFGELQTFFYLACHWSVRKQNSMSYGEELVSAKKAFLLKQVLSHLIKASLWKWISLLRGLIPAASAAAKQQQSMVGRRDGEWAPALGTPHWCSGVKTSHSRAIYRQTSRREELRRCGRHRCH